MSLAFQEQGRLETFDSILSSLSLMLVKVKLCFQLNHSVHALRMIRLLPLQWIAGQTSFQNLPHEDVTVLSLFHLRWQRLE